MKDDRELFSLDCPIFKGGIIAYTKQLATTLAQHSIRANCLSLGGLQETAPNDYFLPRYNQRVPLGRMATGEDVAGPHRFPGLRYLRLYDGTQLGR